MKNPNSVSFYAILPAPVRYCEDLSSTEKLVYAELSAMVDDKGFCSPTNKQLGDIMGLQVRAIIASITNLRKQGFIQTYLAENHIRTIQIKLF